MEVRTWAEEYSLAANRLGSGSESETGSGKPGVAGKWPHAGEALAAAVPG